MRRVIVFEATEEEMTNLMNKHFNTDEEGFVALEELGNQKWVINVNPENLELSNFLEHDKNNKLRVKISHAQEALRKMCFDKVLEPGKYIIDCTW